MARPVPVRRQRGLNGADTRASGTSAQANDIWSGPHLSEEGLEVAIRVELHVRDLTTEEDAALLEALDLEGSPPAGGWIRLGGPMGGGRRIKGVWDRQRRKT